MRALKFHSLFLYASQFLMAIFSNCSSASEQQQQPVVDIPTLGRLVGSHSIPVTVVGVRSKVLRLQSAIPFALPPVGDLRFKVRKLEFI
jgi:hypothetical protein